MLTIRLPEDIRDRFSAACAASNTTASSFLRGVIDRAIKVHEANAGAILGGTRLLETVVLDHCGRRVGTGRAGTRLTVRSGKRPGDPARVMIEWRGLGGDRDETERDYRGSVERLLAWIVAIEKADEETGHRAIIEFFKRAKARWDEIGEESLRCGGFYDDGAETFQEDDLGAVAE